MNWLAHVLGLDNVSGPWYAFWSGAGSDLSELAIIGAAWVWVRKHNCHARGCLRLARHPVEGTPYVACAKHHPDVPDGGPSAAQIAEADRINKVAQR